MLIGKVNSKGTVTKMIKSIKTNPMAIIACVITLMITLFCLGSIRASAETYSGNCGKGGDGSNVKWSLDTETGELRISGKGDMESAPWISYEKLITSVVIENGVTSICDEAFL